MDDETAIKLHDLSQKMAYAILGVLREHSTLNEYQDLLALAAFYFKFKKTTIDAITKQAHALGVSDDIGLNIERILTAIESEITSLDFKEEDEITLPMQPSPTDEYGPN